MPETVLLILKITGIVLAAVVALIILLLLCVLFVPVRYKAVLEADYGSATDDSSVHEREAHESSEEKKTSQLELMLKASWLLFVRLIVERQKETRIRLKICGITLFDSAKEKKDNKKKAATEKKDKETAEKTADTTKSEATGKVADTTKEEVTTKKVNTTKSETSPKAADATKNPFQKLRYAISRICDKLRNIKEKKDALINFWNDAQTVNSRKLLFQEFRYLLKHIKPDQIQGYLHFGFEDPAMTGYGMALYGMMIPVWGNFLQVQPEFEEQIFQGNVKAKGRLRTVHFIKVVLKLFLSKDVKSVIKQAKALK